MGNQGESASHAEGADDDQTSQDSDFATAIRSGQVMVWRSYGIRRLIRWAGGRVVCIVIVAGLSAVFWMVGIRSSHWVYRITVPTKATVTSAVPVIGLPKSDTYMIVNVRFKARSGQIVNTTIYPKTTRRPAPGQQVPIIYDPNVPSHAVYAGRSGVVLFNGPWISAGGAQFVVAVLLGLAVTLLVTGIWRLLGIMLAARADVITPLRLRISDKIAYAYQLSESYALEWRLLQRMPSVARDVHILGVPASGRWLIVRQDDGRLVWPASQAQPVLASAPLRLPVVQPSPVQPVRLLLAGYVQIADLLGTLPVVIRRPPGKTKWWAIGAPRPVVKTLVTLHLRRRVAKLRSALLRAALLCNDEPNSQSRRIFSDTSDECKAFAEAMLRRSLLTVLATAAATILSIVSPFLLLPHVPLTGRTLRLWILPSLAFMPVVFGWVLLTIFIHSVRCKTALFSPASGSSDWPISESAELINTDVDVYKLERAAFDAVQLPQPKEWESPALLLAAFIYVAAIIVYLRFYSNLPGIITVSALVVLLSIVRQCYRWQRNVHGPATYTLVAHAPKIVIRSPEHADSHHEPPRTRTYFDQPSGQTADRLSDTQATADQMSDEEPLDADQPHDS